VWIERAAKEGRIESWEGAIEALAGKQSDPRAPSITPVPRLWPELQAIDYAHAILPKDQDGRTSHAEIRSWLAEEGVTESVLRELCFDLFAALDAEMAAIRARRWEKVREEAESKRRR
jgi:hypothetical protein